MLYKVVKPSGKDVEERESLMNKKKPKAVNSDKKTRAKSSGEPPASLEALNYFGRNINDPQVKLKLLEVGPQTPAQQEAAGVEQLVRHMNSVLGDKYSFRKENHEGSVSGSAKKVDKYKNKSLEKVTRSNDASVNKNSIEGTKSEKMDFSRKPLGLKSKSYICEFPERKSDRKMLSTTPERKKNYNSQERLSYGKKRESPERKRLDGSKKEISKSQSAVEPMNKKSLRRSEIPLLKSRQNWEKKTEVVSFLMHKPLHENDSMSSIDFSPNMKDHPVSEFNASSELEIILRADDSSSQLDDIGEVTNLESSTGGMPETPENLLTCSNMPLDLKTSDLNLGEKKTFRASRAKTLDLEKVKTSSFTVLRAEGDSLNRLETFHKQNITAKETARAEIAIKASKIMLMASKPSFSSINQKKNFPAPGADKGNNSNLKKTKKNKIESQETICPKKSAKKSETPHLDICKEIIATGKVGCLIPKRVTDEKRNKCASSEGKISLRSRVECREKTEGKTINRQPSKEKEHSRKNKICDNSEEKLNISASPVLEDSKFADMSEDDGESSEVRTSETFTIESPPRDIDAIYENEIEEVADEEIKLTPRELASLVVTGTALNFDDIEVYEERQEVNKIKLEIKIDVPSEEDVTDSDAVECESNGNASASFDRLLMSKMQSNEKQRHELPHRGDKEGKEKLASWHLLAEELKTGEWQNNETVLHGAHQSLSSVQKRPHFTKRVLNINGIEKKRGFESEDRWSFSGDPYKCSMFFQNDNKQDAATYTKVRSGLTRASNRDEKIFDNPNSLKLRRRNSEPYSLRGFIWKRADVMSPKSLKPSVSSVASSLRHLNTDDMDDFIFWEAVPQKFTSCWEMSLYHFKRPWSVLSFSVFKDNRRSNTPGVILDTLRSGGVTNLRRPILYQNDRISRRKGNLFDVEPSISQKNIDIRNWLAALNFTAPISNTTDVITETILSVPPALDTPKQANPRRRNVMSQFRLPDKVPEKKLSEKVKNRKFDKWSINDMQDLKELIRKESGSYVTKEQNILSEFSNIRSTTVANACTYTSATEKSVLKESENQNTQREARLIKSVETSCQSESPEEVFVGQEQLKLKETPDSSSASLKSEMAYLPPEVNIWKYLFLFILMFIIFHYSFGSNFVIHS